MENSKGLSELSGFIKNKISDKGWSTKNFIEKSGLSKSYCYELVSGKRDFTPGDDTLEVIAGTLELSEDDRKYIFDLAARERESDEIIYPSDDLEEPPVEPEPAEPTEPDKPEPDEPEEPTDPVEPPEPEPDPQPPAPVPDGAGEVS